MRAIVHYFRVRFAVLPLVDAFVLIQSMIVGYEMRLVTTEMLVPALHGLLFASVMLLSMTALGLYAEAIETFRETVQRIFAAYLITLLVLAGVFFVLPESSVGRGVFAIASVSSLAGLLLVRYAASRLGMIEMPGRRVLVLGDGEEADKVIGMVNGSSKLRLARMVAHVPINGMPGRNEQLTADQLPDTVEARRVTDIVVAIEDQRCGRIPLKRLLDCKLKGVRVHDLASFYEQELGLVQLAHLRTSWLIYGNGFDQSTVRTVVKRFFDLVVSSLMLIVTLPVMSLAALAVLIETGRPALFRQERVREHGRVFLMMKFRSMRQDAERDGRPRWAATDDDRITRVGKFLRATRIDELPQLINVLKGDMSFVGPRPERPYFVEQLTEAIPYYGIRHNIKPGITGWAQVRMPYGASVEEAKKKLEYDLYYVKNHAFFLDLMILFETVQVVLRKKGAR